LTQEQLLGRLGDAAATGGGAKRPQLFEPVLLVVGGGFAGQNCIEPKIGQSNSKH
jgi:hypothetical protein